MHQVKYALVNSDPQLASKPFEERARLCYSWDRVMVEDAELVVADASFPSTGLGIEMQIAEHKGTPIVLSFWEATRTKTDPVSYTNPDHSHHQLQIGEGFVTLMALGIPNIFRVVRYSDFDAGITSIVDATNLLTK
jgi:hypothetical protein